MTTMESIGWKHSIFIGMVITEVCSPSSKLDYTLNICILLHVNYASLNFLNVDYPRYSEEVHSALL